MVILVMLGCWWRWMVILVVLAVGGAEMVRWCW